MTSPAGGLPEAVRDIGKVHHVALIVRSIDAALALWRDMLHLELETVMDIPATACASRSWPSGSRRSSWSN